MIALLSNGITSPQLKNALYKHLHPLSNAAIVVSADNVYKEKNYHVPRITRELQDFGLTVTTFDLDIQEPAELLKYDVVEFMGGNPYYLLHSIRVHNASNVIKEIAAKKVLIGWSAGALILTPSIDLVDKLTPEMNVVDIKDMSALALFGTCIVPHYTKFLNRYENLENICKQYEKETHSKLIQLNDGDGIIIENGVETLILGS